MIDQKQSSPKKLQSKSQNLKNDISLDQDDNFEKAGLPSSLLQCYQVLGWIHPTPIQFYSIRQSLANIDSDVLGQSKSGTGKTLSYLSLILMGFISRDSTSNTEVLMIVPTRELAIQVYQNFKQIQKATQHILLQEQEERKIRSKIRRISLMLSIGGMPIEDEKKQLKQDGANLVIGTIGRIAELVDRKYLSTSQLKMLVLDEADKLYENRNKKFRTFVDQILSMKKQNIFSVRLLMFSATYNRKIILILKQRQCVFVQTLAKQNEELFINITKQRSKFILAQDIEDEKVKLSDSILNLSNIKKYKIKIVAGQKSLFQSKIDSLTTILRDLEYQRCLIFVEKKILIEQIEQRLIQASFEPLLIHGSLSQSSRIKIMNQANKSKIIVSSDLLARGIDLKIDLVVLFDAKRTDNLWHRIGRTGRYGRVGVVVSLDDVEDWPDYNQEEIQKELQQVKFSGNQRPEMYGEFMTEIGSWKETYHEKQVAQEKQYKYFDQQAFQQGRKKFHNDPIAKQNKNNMKLQTTFKTQNELSLYLKELLSCSKCKQLVESVQKLTGYQFQLMKYLY